MIEHLDTVTLKTGEKVAASVVIGPEPAWAERVEQLLIHKGDFWNWQNSQVLRQNLGLDAHFYLLHRNGQPFANIMTIEHNGVGLFGHVWTNPADRQKGASRQLMTLQMAHFQQRGGQALFLGTGYDSVAYHIYTRFGFESIEPGSGLMHYYAEGQTQFEATYFAEGETKIMPLAWTHWPASAALFMGDFPGVVRCAPLKLFGRSNTEGPFLRVLYPQKDKAAPPRSYVLQNTTTSALVGFTTWDWHPLWPDTCLLDLYCHPNYWGQGSDLFAALTLPAAQRYIAYGDAGCVTKHQVLLEHGFQQTHVLHHRLASGVNQMADGDVIIFEKYNV